MSDGFGILLALAAVVVPLGLAWFLCARFLEPRGTSQTWKRAQTLKRDK